MGRGASRAILMVAALVCAGTAAAQATALDQLRAAAGDGATVRIGWRDGGHDRGRDHDHDHDHDHEHHRWRDHDHDHDHDRWHDRDRDRSGPIVTPAPVPDPVPVPVPGPSEPPAYMSPGAVAICNALGSQDGVGECLDAVRDRQYFGEELSGCAARPTDDAKISCLGAAGRPVR